MPSALIIFFGKAINSLPIFLLRWACFLSACIVILFFRKRFKLLLENLSHSFPDLPFAKILSVARISISRTIEQGLLALVWPHLQESQLARNFSISNSNLGKLRTATLGGKGVLWLIPHFCHADALSFLPSLMGEGHQVHALFRPLKDVVLNDFIRNSRERFGVTTINRKGGGMIKTLKVLRDGNTLAMLFDQNAGMTGTRMNFMGRKCSCTTLPDILLRKYAPKVLFVYTRRIGFWKSVIEVEELGVLKKNEMTIEHANRWLESKLINDKILCETWLWLHQRWKPLVGKKAQIK